MYEKESSCNSSFSFEDMSQSALLGGEKNKPSISRSYIEVGNGGLGFDFIPKSIIRLLLLRQQLRL